MNELPTTPEPTQTDANASSKNEVKPDTVAQSSPRTPGKNSQTFIHIALLVVAAGLGASWWNSHSDLKNLREDVARRLHTGDTSNSEMKIVLKSTQESVKELESKFSVLDNKQSEAQSQQLALEQLYQELSKNRDDWVLSEIEEVLSTASQQLELAGNIQGALIALQNADRNLARFDKPQFITIRRAIAADQEKLKAVPNVDITGIAIRLDSIIGQVDALPLLSDEKTVEETVAPKESTAEVVVPVVAEGTTGEVVADGMTPDWRTTLHNGWQSLTTEMWAGLKQLISIRRVDTPDALMLSPSQSYFVRENLKLRLLNARLALLSRNEFAFRNDLNTAQDIVAKYFDTRAKQVQSVQALVKQVQESDLTIQMPTLSESINAVHSYNNAKR
jgi:uroporphyrin-3 C-methyltransferase